MKPKDLVPYIGSKSKVSEVLSRQRPLSLSMIRKLVTGLHFPAEVALQVTKATPAKRAKNGRGKNPRTARRLQGA